MTENEIILRLKELEETILSCSEEIVELEKYLKINFPKFPQLSEEEFSMRYPNLYLDMRLEDHNPAMLERWNHENSLIW